LINVNYCNIAIYETSKRRSKVLQPLGTCKQNNSCLQSVTDSQTIQYDTIEEFNVDSKAEYTA